MIAPRHSEPAGQPANMLDQARALFDELEARTSEAISALDREDMAAVRAAIIERELIQNRIDAALAEIEKARQTIARAGQIGAAAFEMRLQPVVRSALQAQSADQRLMSQGGDVLTRLAREIGEVQHSETVVSAYGAVVPAGPRFEIIR